MASDFRQLKRGYVMHLLTSVEAIIIDLIHSDCDSAAAAANQ